MSAKSDLPFRERNNQAVKKYMADKETITIRVDKGTGDRFRALGIAPATYFKELAIKELARLEKADKRKNKE